MGRARPAGLAGPARARGREGARASQAERLFIDFASSESAARLVQNCSAMLQNGHKVGRRSDRDEPLNGLGPTAGRTDAGVCRFTSHSSVSRGLRPARHSRRPPGAPGSPASGAGLARPAGRLAPVRSPVERAGRKAAIDKLSARVGTYRAGSRVVDLRLSRRRRPTSGARGRPRSLGASEWRRLELSPGRLLAGRAFPADVSGERPGESERESAK